MGTALGRATRFGRCCWGPRGWGLVKAPARPGSFPLWKAAGRVSSSNKAGVPALRPCLTFHRPLSPPLSPPLPFFLSPLCIPSLSLPSPSLSLSLPLPSLHPLPLPPLSRRVKPSSLCGPFRGLDSMYEAGKVWVRRLERAGPRVSWLPWVHRYLVENTFPVYLLSALLL